MRQLKLIWDFRGPDALKIAEHHEIHLKEYIQAEKLALNITGFEAINDLYAIAYLVVNEDQMKPVRDRLKPHRGQVYTAQEV
ncbi:hypothetical protein [Lacinutrix sp. 5H-3-7-4]|uniref:hypothetical protein n=1 Tax=Lacinutrix sp. (strain 5H-3-7-4) TaxID=983544 RepID=UPI00020A36D8|nr:hypothetical protein [Lacinutrix sp. 5H-3-7-4]AEG99923.1 hypothetical protein Lacal_0071 [Lacinutrix sp. 5H-3-7-4]